MTKKNQERLGLSAFIGMLLGGVFDDLLFSTEKENVLNTTPSSNESCVDECEEYFENELLDIDLF